MAQTTSWVATSHRIAASDRKANALKLTYEKLIKRDKVNLDVFWLKDERLEDSANLPNPDVLAAEIMEDLEAEILQFTTIRGGSEI